MRLKVAGAGIVAAAVLAGPAVSNAGIKNLRVVAPPAGVTAGYVTKLTVAQKGKTAGFLNLDIVAHDVVSVARRADGQPLFKSALVGLGGATNIVGTAALPVGTYAFFCSLHPGMKASLRIIK